MRRLLCVVATLALGSAARAQYPYPPQPQFNPQQFQPPQPQFNPQQFQPPPAYDPNQVVGYQNQGNWVQDPVTGQWRQNTQADTTYNSANSPGRNTMVPGSRQNYTYKDASGRLVQGTRWLGQDGLWHGDQSTTSQNATGGLLRDNVHYNRPPTMPLIRRPRPQ
jgi:hypothetical protein